MKKMTKIIVRALVSLVIAAGVFLAGAFLCVIITFTSIHQVFFTLTVLTGAIGIGLLLLAWNIRLRLLGWVGCGVFLLALVACGGKFAHSWWTYGRFAVIKQGVNWYNYQPFAPNNKLVSVKVSEAQKMRDELPRIDGAYAFYPVYAAAVQAIFPQGNYQRTVQTNGSDVTFSRLLAGETDMIFSLAPSKQQLDDAKSVNLTYEMTPFMREAFVFYVNAKNPVSNVSSEQIRGIYSGKITNWQEVGALESAKIIPFQRNKGSGSQTTLEAIMGDIPIMEPLKEDKLGGMGGIIQDTADYRNYNEAIGFSFRYFATEMIKNDQIKLLSIDGIAPSRENIINGSYPFIADGYIITVKPRSRKVQRFIDFILSPQGREIVEKTGYVFFGGMAKGVLLSKDETDE